ncbi:hypothetical protein ACI48D_05050 [Massilia sp. LXY-6]|uniref:hypothetical protein n=1 Tax=Massilia sp. LXY-6 TaxID=3379823 RepID=UPI003EE3E1E8
MPEAQNIDVVLVNPGSRSAVYQKLGDELSAIEPPTLAGLFATYLRRNDLSVGIIDAPAHSLSQQAVADLALEAKLEKSWELPSSWIGYSSIATNACRCAPRH